jgi:hypothetical protein
MSGRQRGVMVAIGAAVVLGFGVSASAGEPDRGFGGVNRDPSGGVGTYVDPRRGVTGRDHVNEMNPVYVPGQSSSPAGAASGPVWVPGSWWWNGYGWVWIPGYWVR